MKALEYLKKEQVLKKHQADVTWGYYDKDIDEAIKELEELQEKKSLVKTLEKMNEEMIDLRKENQDLKSRSCNECKHYLDNNGNYPLEPCSECSRFYSDKFESK